MRKEPVMRMVCLMFLALLLLTATAFAEARFPFDPKKGGIEAEGPGGVKKPVRIKYRVIPHRIVIVSADPSRGAITKLYYDEPFRIRLIFERLPSNDRQEVLLSQGANGASIIFSAKRVGRTKIFETGVVVLTRGKRSVTRARTNFPFRPGMGHLLAETRPGKTKKRILTFTSTVSEGFQKRIKNKAAPEIRRITRKYRGAAAKYENSLAVRWTGFLSRRKRLEDKMARAANKCDRARYAQAAHARDRDYDAMRRYLRAERNRYLVLPEKLKARKELLNYRLGRLQERWNALSLRAKATSVGNRLVEAGAKFLSERWDTSYNISLSTQKLELLKDQNTKLRRTVYRYRADLSRCKPAPVRTIGVVPYGAYKDRGEGSSSNGKIVFACRDLQCTGTYKGSAEGTPAVMVGVFSLRTATFNGFWIESKSRRKCATRMRNSYYWGRVKFVFKQDARSWSGKWGRCTGSLTKSWHGRK